MTPDSEIALLKQLPSLPPAVIRRHAETLRQQALECARLAADCLTEDARQVLEDMADELRAEAEELDSALRTIRRLYSDKVEIAPGVSAGS